MMTKKEIRKEIKSRLMEMSDGERAAKSAIIEKKICGAQVFISSRSVFVYMADELEVWTEGVIREAQNLGKKVYLPLVSGDNMSIVELTAPLAFTEFTKNKWGIKELTNSKNIGNPSEIDLVIVPVVGATERGDRLGHGKGYYDKFFTNCNAYKMAICYGEQLIADIPTEKHDVKMDVVITNL